MVFKAILSMLGLTEQIRIDIFRLVIALWSFSVGYLLYKRACHTFSQQPVKTSLQTKPDELPFIPGENYRATEV